MALEVISRAKVVRLLDAIMHDVDQARTALGSHDRVSSAKEAGDYLEKQIRDPQSEIKAMLLLDDSLHIVGYRELVKGPVARGSLNAIGIARIAVKTNAARVILMRYSPSGRVLPSFEERVQTLQVSDALRGVGVKLEDHVIVSRRQRLSYVIEGIPLARDRSRFRGREDRAR